MFNYRSIGTKETDTGHFQRASHRKTRLKSPEYLAELVVEEKCIKLPSCNYINIFSLHNSYTTTEFNKKRRQRTIPWVTCGRRREVTVLDFPTDSQAQNTRAPTKVSMPIFFYSWSLHRLSLGKE